MPRNAYTLWVGGLGILLIVGVVAYILLDPAPEPTPVPEPEPIIEVPEPEPTASTKVIGTSVEGRDISVHTFGTGDTHILFVGGIHGGYEWNSVLLAYEFIEFGEIFDRLPENTMVSVIPNLNPDGLFAVVPVEGPFAFTEVPNPSNRVAEGRFNANGVDLNRNFDCNWAPESTWRGNVVSAGTGPFSEPEAAALRDYVLQTNPDAVIFWHSQANNVYASECNNGPLPETLEIMQRYADAGEYGAVASFDAYPITGDAEGWLASIGIPAITVELESFDSIEFGRNMAGVDALFEYYGAPTYAR